MGLDVWFAEDVARALRAARVAGQEARRAIVTADDLNTDPLLAERQAGYWQGYEAALATIGAAFGINLVEAGARDFTIVDDEGDGGGHRPRRLTGRR